MSATPHASQNRELTKENTSNMLHDQKTQPLTHSENTQLEPEASTDEQVKDLEAKGAPHDKTSSATPKIINASVAGSYSSIDLSPASTLGTTVSGGNSVPVTPVQARFTNDRNASFSAISDQGSGSPSKTKSQPAHYDCDTDPRAMNHSRLDGGVSLSRSKVDSCPDRLASMVQELELRENKVSTEPPQSLVPRIRDINNFSSGARNVEQHPMGNESNNTSTTQAKHTVGISAENAQSIYPPEACVFVANLAKEHSDPELLKELHRLFATFGECWIIIRREISDSAIPFAFVQYKTRKEAEVALSQGPGKYIFGRPCRVEATRAHRAVYVTRKDGKQPSKDEIYTLLNDHKISEVWTPTMTEMETHKLGNGIWVRFEFYGECKEAIKLFRNDPIYYLVYKDFDSRQKDAKTKHHGRAMSAQAYWKPRSPTLQNKRTPVERPWGSPHMSSRPLAIPNAFSANGSWCDPFPALASNVPLQPLVSYPQATSHGLSSAPNTANTGSFPPMNTLSDCNFGIYGFHNQPNSAYPQSHMPPISPNHNQVGMLLGYPLSSTGSQFPPIPFSIFREPNFPGIPLATGGLLNASTIHHGNNASANIINRPSPAVITNPSGPHQNPVLQPYSNPPVMNMSMTGSLRPPNAITAGESSPFHDTSLFTGQLPEPYGGFSTESVPPEPQNIMGAGQLYEHHPCDNNFGLDGATGQIDPAGRHNSEGHLRASSI